jgi:hypothetical protein
MKLNPLLRYRLEIEERITALEDRFGFNLQARQRLGLNALRAESLEQLNARQQAEHDEEDDDPRAGLRVVPIDKRRRRGEDG